MNLVQACDISAQARDGATPRPGRYRRVTRSRRRPAGRSWSDATGCGAAPKATRAGELVGPLGNHGHRQLLPDRSAPGSSKKWTSLGSSSTTVVPAPCRVGASSRSEDLSWVSLSDTACVVVSGGRHRSSSLLSDGLTHFAVLTRGAGSTPFTRALHRSGARISAAARIRLRASGSPASRRRRPDAAGATQRGRSRDPLNASVIRNGAAARVAAATPLSRRPVSARPGVGMPTT